jgi:3-dehydroquinate synthetase
MKYTSILCLLLSIFVNSSKAQIVFTSDELITSFMQQNSQSNFVPASLDGLQALIDKSGPSQTWDFTAITWEKDTTANTSTSTLLQYPGGAALADDTDFIGSTHVMKGVSSVPNNPISYAFLKIDPLGYWILDIGGESG